MPYFLFLLVLSLFPFPPYLLNASSFQLRGGRFTDASLTRLDIHISPSFLSSFFFFFGCCVQQLAHIGREKRVKEEEEEKKNAFLYAQRVQSTKCSRIWCFCRGLVKTDGFHSIFEASGIFKEGMIVVAQKLLFTSCGLKKKKGRKSSERRGKKRRDAQQSCPDVHSFARKDREFMCLLWVQTTFFTFSKATFFFSVHRYLCISIIISVTFPLFFFLFRYCFAKPCFRLLSCAFQELLFLTYLSAWRCPLARVTVRKTATARNSSTCWRADEKKKCWKATNCLPCWPLFFP